MSDSAMDRSDLPILPFPSAELWEAWLRENHTNPVGIWLRLAKKDAGHASVTYDEALDVALCYGWIDGQRKPFDGEWHLVRFTPRRARSPWSRLNVERVDRLVASGRMQPSGLLEVEKARADGRWAAAYEPASSSTIPDDLQAALDGNPSAQAFFETLDRQNRYAILYRTGSAKRPETRARRIREFVDMLARGEKIHS